MRQNGVSPRTNATMSQKSQRERISESKLSGKKPNQKPILSSSSKSQSAMEYLMTYGWAILVVAIVIIALFQLGVLGGNAAGAGKCLAGSGYLCASPMLNSNGQLQVTFGQFSGSSMVLTGINCSSTNTAPSVWSAVSPSVNVITGGEASIVLSCPVASNAIGTSFSGSLWVQYNNAAGTGYVAKFATISTKVSTSAALGSFSTTTVLQLSTTTVLPTCYSLTLTDGTGGASATASPSNSVGCSSGQYVSGAVITLTATASSGDTFHNWTGTSSSSANPWSYSMPASAATETANFYASCSQTIISYASDSSVPFSATVSYTMYGGGGGGGGSGSGANGATATGSFSVVTGNSITVYVGGGGGGGCWGGGGGGSGYYGGGGGVSTANNGCAGGGGGGSSAILYPGSTLVQYASGGAGGPSYGLSTGGGGGGSTSGGSGGTGNSYPGSNGASMVGGNAGTYVSGAGGIGGNAGNGGSGGTASQGFDGGGGGGYGGGGGGASAGSSAPYGGGGGGNNGGNGGTAPIGNEPGATGGSTGAGGVETSGYATSGAGGSVILTWTGPATCNI